MLSMQLSNMPDAILCIGETKMCKRTKHLSIQDNCWIFRIQAEDFTRGGDKFRGIELRPPSELCIHILCKL